MTDRERLSRLLDGDLSEGDRVRLLDRLAEEPALRHQWETLQSLDGRLAELVVPVPAHLNAAALGADADSTPSAEPPPLVGQGVTSSATEDIRITANSARYWPWAAAMALAALGLFWLQTGRTEIHLLEGSQRLDGNLVALAGEVAVDVDGVAVITVEPRPGVAREWAQEDPMSKTALLSALAGAAVTIAVYEGSARVLAEDGTPAVVVHAGETHHVPAKPSVGGRPEPRRVVRNTPTAASNTGADGAPATVAELQEANARLQEQLDALQFEGALVKGQLKAHQGEPVDWPADPPEGYAPESFKTNLEAVLKTHPDMELVSVDCAEFPCVAMLTGPADDDEWQKRMSAVPEQFAADHLGEGVNMQIMLGGSDDAGVMTGAVGFAAYPEGQDGGRDGEIETRSDYRMRSLLEQAMGE